jgi:tRNA1(Val) A37 N6-methylase TrmN6
MEAIADDLHHALTEGDEFMALMTQEMQDLKSAVDAVMADAAGQSTEIDVAIEHIMVNPPADPTVAATVLAATQSLKAAHDANTANFAKLKAAVDKVMASGGPATP